MGNYLKKVGDYNVWSPIVSVELHLASTKNLIGSLYSGIDRYIPEHTTGYWFWKKTVPPTVHYGLWDYTLEDFLRLNKQYYFDPINVEIRTHDHIIIKYANKDKVTKCFSSEEEMLLYIKDEFGITENEITQ